MRVDEIMTKTVETIRSDATIYEAITKLVQHRISGLPVVDGAGKLVGMVTEGDLLRRAELGTAHKHRELPGLFGGRDRVVHEEAKDYVRDHSKRVSDIMTRNPVSVHESTALSEAVALMEQHGIRRVPVVTLGGLVGILSRSDLVRHLGNLMRGSAMLRRDDEEIRTEVLEELNRQVWFKKCKINVAVHDGHVRFAGTLHDGSIGAALRVAAETVPGVISVRVPIAS
ncbi:MAG: CBS domain-containing protein [Beijerinckiaceae bacterium]|jgi:CBS domain-containing protein